MEILFQFLSIMIAILVVILAIAFSNSLRIDKETKRLSK